MRNNGGRRPDEILADIDRTRGEMDRTLTAIEQRLTPGQLVDQGLDYLKGSGAKEFASNLGGAAKNNPLPVALVGIGLTWLMALGRQPAQREGMGSLREKASGMMHGTSERISSARQQLAEKMGSMREGASGGIGSMRERYGQMSESARQQWQRARGGVDYLVHEQPLALGAIGLAIGALLGGAAPRTRKEAELMGEASRGVIDKAREAAQPVLEQAREAAQMRKEPQSSGTPPAPPSTPTTPRPPRQGL